MLQFRLPNRLIYELPKFMVAVGLFYEIPAPTRGPRLHVSVLYGTCWEIHTVTVPNRFQMGVLGVIPCVGCLLREGDAVGGLWRRRWNIIIRCSFLCRGPIIGGGGIFVTFSISLFGIWKSSRIVIMQELIFLVSLVLSKYGCNHIRFHQSTTRRPTHGQKNSQKIFWQCVGLLQFLYSAQL